ncbi:hypothetical protein BC834DRAFT_845531 [Gloeopeniophorella convolvens]|nr:hypothetical protein BC834DRAFT_845531 [Gloeopeniophorella convolvens]
MPSIPTSFILAENRRVTRSMSKAAAQCNAAIIVRRPLVPKLTFSDVAVKSKAKRSGKSTGEAVPAKPSAQVKYPFKSGFGFTAGAISRRTPERRERLRKERIAFSRRAREFHRKEALPKIEVSVETVRQGVTPYRREYVGKCNKFFRKLPSPASLAPPATNFHGQIIASDKFNTVPEIREHAPEEWDKFLPTRRPEESPVRNNASGDFSDEDFKRFYPREWRLIQLLSIRPIRVGKKRKSKSKSKTHRRRRRIALELGYWDARAGLDSGCDSGYSYWTPDSALLALYCLRALGLTVFCVVQLAYGSPSLTGWSESMTGVLISTTDGFTQAEGEFSVYRVGMPERTHGASIFDIHKMVHIQFNAPVYTRLLSLSHPRSRSAVNTNQAFKCAQASQRNPVLQARERTQAEGELQRIDNQWSSVLASPKGSKSAEADTRSLVLLMVLTGVLELQKKHPWIPAIGYPWIPSLIPITEISLDPCNRNIPGPLLKSPWIFITEILLGSCHRQLLLSNSDFAGFSHNAASATPNGSRQNPRFDLRFTVWLSEY